jgi:tetratricopeptide (TPR) repeat protein
MIFILFIDTYFVANDFNGAIEALCEAIMVDKQFTAYWETIGDTLAAEGQNEDALFAYELCFTCLPGNISLLKKIGDCYLAMNQLEAAKETFEQLKTKMAELNLSNPDSP